MKTLKTSFNGGDKSQGWACFFLAVEAVAAFVFLLVGRVGFVPRLFLHPRLYFTAITVRVRVTWEQLMLYFNIILSSLVFRTHSDSSTFPHFYNISVLFDSSELKREPTFSEIATFKTISLHVFSENTELRSKIWCFIPFFLLLFFTKVVTQLVSLVKEKPLCGKDEIRPTVSPEGGHVTLNNAWKGRIFCLRVTRQHFSGCKSKSPRETSGPLLSHHWWILSVACWRNRLPSPFAANKPWYCPRGPMRSALQRMVPQLPFVFIMSEASSHCSVGSIPMLN